MKEMGVKGVGGNKTNLEMKKNLQIRTLKVIITVLHMFKTFTKHNV